ncbi:MAG: hypothetical protein BSOLF_0258 [Candidatus Carbobacillus altaicus]|uniref:DUF1540 domain-containing protein n=1 Tax=Candidatus Carbonibacillus altaicus TaxID=2163959 RepID=A0A2R6Y164_9BACL|nr:MAG: hypothetical protein BSOLF_0258 [Candidatus Carbobacillus altaicus]
MPANVFCTVSNCVFWKSGDLCAAEQITIDRDGEIQSSDVEFASIGAVKRGTVPNKSATRCFTFKGK